MTRNTTGSDAAGRESGHESASATKGAGKPLADRITAVPAPDAIRDDEKVAWIIRYDDGDRGDELFAGFGAAEAARKRFDMLTSNWNVHLFKRVDGLAEELSRLVAKAAGTTWGYGSQVPDNALELLDYVQSNAPAILAALRAPIPPAPPSEVEEVVRAFASLIDDVQEWCDAIRDNGSSWDDWDHHYKALAYGNLDAYRDALSRLRARKDGEEANG